MNCAECRDHLVACAEGLLDREAMLACQAHLETCAGCRAEYQAITGLQQRLAARGQAAAEVSLVAQVMQRVLRERKELEGESFMSKILRHRWGFGLGAAAGAAAIVVAAIITMSPKAFGIEQVIEDAQRDRERPPVVAAQPIRRAKEFIEVGETLRQRIRARQ